MPLPTPRPRATAATLLLGLACYGCTPPPAEWQRESVPEPTIFAPGVISTGLREYGIAFTPDGSEAYFTRRPRRGPAQIFVSRFSEGSWSEPVPAPFGSDRDEAPFITPDGERMLFASRRPMQGSWDRSDNIWTMDRTEEGWSDPTPLPGTVNQPRAESDDFTSGTELGPVLLESGSILYWTRVDPDWGSDIYVADRAEDGSFREPRPLRINSTGDESNPAMSPNGRFLVFQAYRDADAFGDQDLYVSRRTEHGWSTPRLLPEPFNSMRADGYPSFTPDGRFFFFASDRDNRGGYWDIFYVDYAALDLDGVTR